MEASARPRAESNISDVDLTDTEHCVLCFNTLDYFGMGKCEHKHVCLTCTLRLRLIIKNVHCPICKTDLTDGIAISMDRKITWKKVLDNEDDFIEDDDDESIWYEDKEGQMQGMKLRALNCPIKGCDWNHYFKNLEQLKRHYEQAHGKTFCKICLEGRLVFQKEQKLYDLKDGLRKHLEYGDFATAKFNEVLPHPWCNFCEQYFFNDLTFFDHLSKIHLTCNLCGDAHKNVYYNHYESLEEHFSQSHYMCPFEQCKSKCYVSFKTENELKTHFEIEHKTKTTKNVSANSLLGVQFDDEHKISRPEMKARTRIMDEEGVDFNYYFSESYNLIHEKFRERKEEERKRGHIEERKQEGGRGMRGQRNQRGNNRGGGQGRGQKHDEEKKTREYQDRKIEKMTDCSTDEERLDLILDFFNRYIQEYISKNDPEPSEFSMNRVLLYQMFVIISKLDAHKLARMDYIMNFGVTVETKEMMMSFMENGGNVRSACQLLEQIPFLQVLKMHRYLAWADIKLHHITFTEDKDDIQENLLIDFLGEDQKRKLAYKQKGGALRTEVKLPQNVIIKKENNSLISGIEFELGVHKQKDKGYVDVNSKEEFPDLMGLGTSQNKKGGKNVNQTSQEGWGNAIFGSQKKDPATSVPVQKKKERNLAQENFPNLDGMAPKLQEKVVEIKKPVEEEYMPTLGEAEQQNSKQVGSTGGKKGKGKKGKTVELKGAFW